MKKHKQQQEEKDNTKIEQNSQQDETNKEELNEIEKLQQELEQITELAKRTMADLQNQKRREEETKSRIIKTANQSIIKDILPIKDALDKAKEHAPEEGKEWFKGIEMSINQLNNILQRNGLEEIEALNKEFNPDLHEALLKGEGKKDHVITVLEKGYTLNGIVIRHAKVQIGE